jgi:hypothetical protein
VQELRVYRMRGYGTPTIGFDLLYALVIVRLVRRDLVWINVTSHPTADWIARQMTEAFPWAEAPRYLIRDRDCVYGAAVTHRLRKKNPSVGIRRMRQNQRIIRRDACHPPPAWKVCPQSVQVTASA